MPYHLAIRMLADGGAEFRRRWRDASSQAMEIRRKPPTRPVETYYESALEQHRTDEDARAPWRELLAWAESQGLEDDFPKETAALREMAASRPAPAREDFEGHLDEEVAEFYLDTGDLERLESLLNANDVPYDEHEFPTGKRVTTVDFGDPDGPWVVETGPEELEYWRDPQEWLDSASERPEEFYEERDASTEFWEGVGPGSALYHATDAANVASILRGGLRASADTRGLENTDIGPAVFAIGDWLADDPAEALGAYGDAVVRIDVGAMKADGYMPEVVGETPLEEASLKESLAHGIGWEYDAERGSDYMEDTVAILGDVSPKYLSLVE